MLVAVLGGLLGILMMIPLRRALIVAAARHPQVPRRHRLRRGAEGRRVGRIARRRVRGSARRKRKHAAAPAPAPRRSSPASASASSTRPRWSPSSAGRTRRSSVFGSAVRRPASVAAEISPELLGVGYIIGPRIAVDHVRRRRARLPRADPGDQVLRRRRSPAPLAPGDDAVISDMSPGEIRSAYVLYIGAGAVAAGGIISLFRSLPTIWHGLQGRPARRLAARAAQRAPATLRTDHDLSMQVRAHRHHRADRCHRARQSAVRRRHRHHGAHRRGAADRRLRLPLRHRVVAAHRRDRLVVEPDLRHDGGHAAAHLPGLPGRSAGPGRNYYVTALSIGAIVCIAASNGGTTSQDLKTGFLVGATPRHQQIAILVGALASALVLGPILLEAQRRRHGLRAAVGKAPAGDAAGSREAGRTGQRRPSCTANARSSADPHRRHRRQDLPRLAPTDDPSGGTAGSTSSTTPAMPVYFVDPGINGTHHEAAGRRADGAEVRRAEGDADVVHHQGHPRAASCRGAWCCSA